MFMILLILIFILGFLAAIPAGPVQIEVVRRSIHGHLLPAMLMILAAGAIDFIYGIIAVFGIAPFLEQELVMAAFWLGGGLILLVLGFLAVRLSLRGQSAGAIGKSYLGRKRWALVGGLALSAMNPIMILWWLSSLHIFQDLGLLGTLSRRQATAYVTAGSLGFASYLVVLSLLLRRVKYSISDLRLRQVNAGMGVVLVLLAGYFLIHSIRVYIRMV